MGTPRVGFPLRPPQGFLSALIAKQDLDDQMLVDNTAQLLLPFRKVRAGVVQRPDPVHRQPLAGIPSNISRRRRPSCKSVKTKAQYWETSAAGHVCGAPCSLGCFPSLEQPRGVRNEAGSEGHVQAF